MSPVEDHRPISNRSAPIALIALAVGVVIGVFGAVEHRANLRAARASAPIDVVTRDTPPAPKRSVTPSSSSSPKAYRVGFVDADFDAAPLLPAAFDPAGQPSAVVELPSAKITAVVVKRGFEKVAGDLAADYGNCQRGFTSDNNTDARILRCTSSTTDFVAVVAAVEDGATAVYTSAVRHDVAPKPPAATPPDAEHQHCGSAMRFLEIPSHAEGQNVWGGESSSAASFGGCSWRAPQPVREALDAAVDAVFGAPYPQAKRIRVGLDTERYVVDGVRSGIYWRVSVDALKTGGAVVFVERFDPHHRDALPSRNLDEDYERELRASGRWCAAQLLSSLPSPESGSVAAWREAASLCLYTTSAVSPNRIASPAPFMPNLPQ